LPIRALTFQFGIADPPLWIEVHHAIRPLAEAETPELGLGETAAIMLADEIHADLLLMDDRQISATARTSWMPCSRRINRRIFTAAIRLNLSHNNLNQ